jgi:hypothetical protein
MLMLRIICMVFNYLVFVNNHDVVIENGTSNYFKKEKHNVGCHDNFNDPICVLNYPMLLVSTDDVLRNTSISFDLMIYKMTMHRKKVRLRYCFYALCCSLSCLSLIVILMDLGTPWEPDKKCMEHFLRKKEGSKNCPHGMCTS